MSGTRLIRRKELREELAELKEAAIGRLEHQGYEVRGKTPAQIKQLLRRRPPRQKSKGPGTLAK